MLRNESAQINPIEVLFTVMITIVLMAFVLLAFGSFMDEFVNVINTMDIPLGTWGQSMMDNLPLKYAPYVYLVPTFFIIIMLVWGVKAVIKRHDYTTQQQDEFMADDI